MRKGILFIPLSTNADSMKNIINIVFCDQYCEEKKLPKVDKITFLSTLDKNSTINCDGEKITPNEFVCRIQEALDGDCVEIRQRTIVNYTRDIPNAIMDGIREVGKENIIIDLTCGQKNITGSLYTTASISRIKNMIYVEVLMVDKVYPKLNRKEYPGIKNKFKLTMFESMNEIENLASLNEVDFIFYKQDVQSIRVTINHPKIEMYCSQLDNAIKKYFSDDILDLRDAVRDFGLINEELIPLVAEKLHDEFSSAGIKLKAFKSARSMDTIREIQMLYQAKDANTKEYYPMLHAFFDKVPVLYEMFEILRIYRNRVSHNAESKFLREEVKYLLDTILLIFKGFIENDYYRKFWTEDNNE